MRRARRLKLETARLGAQITTTTASNDSSCGIETAKEWTEKCIYIVSAWRQLGYQTSKASHAVIGTSQLNWIDNVCSIIFP